MGLGLTRAQAKRIVTRGGASQGGDSRVSPSPRGTLHRHSEGKKSRLRAPFLAPIFEPNWRANNGPATSGVTGRATSDDKQRRTELAALSRCRTKLLQTRFLVCGRTKARTRDPPIKSERAASSYSSVTTN
jgi:hypothetical protein